MLAVASRTCAPPHGTRGHMEHQAGHLCTQREITWLAAQDSGSDWDEEDAVEAACTDAAWQASSPSHYAPDSDTAVKEQCRMTEDVLLKVFAELEDRKVFSTAEADRARMGRRAVATIEVPAVPPRNRVSIWMPETSYETGPSRASERCTGGPRQSTPSADVDAPTRRPVFAGVQTCNGERVFSSGCAGECDATWRCGRRADPRSAVLV